MSGATYLWRKLTPKQREGLIAWRKRQGLPWHRPPHRAGDKTRYHVTAACFEHRHYIGWNQDRMQSFCDTLLAVFKGRSALIHAWCGAAERYMRNDAHFWATLNYVHNNPVLHGYAGRWQDWPFSSAPEYLAEMGRTFAEKTWREYPILDYGKGWDDAKL